MRLNQILYEEVKSDGADSGSSSGNSKTVTEAIAEASKTLEKEAGAEASKEESKEDDRRGTATEEQKKLDSKVEKDPDGLDPEQIKHARQLYLALKDPEKAPILLKYFAEQAGYGKVETKEESQEVKDEILEALEEHLGAEFGFLSSKLSKALDKIIKVKFDQHSQEIKQHLEAQQHEKLTNESIDAYKSMAKQYFNKDEIPDNVTKKMSALMDRYKPSGNIGVKDYLNDIFHMAVSQLDVNLKTSKNSPTIDKNRKDVVSRLVSNGAVTESNSVDSSKLKTDGKPRSIADAIRLAKEQVEDEFNK